MGQEVDEVHQRLLGAGGNAKAVIDVAMKEGRADAGVLAEGLFFDVTNE